MGWSPQINFSKELKNIVNYYKDPDVVQDLLNNFDSVEVINDVMYEYAYDVLIESAKKLPDLEHVQEIIDVFKNNYCEMSDNYCPIKIVKKNFIANLYSLTGFKSLKKGPKNK